MSHPLFPTSVAGSLPKPAWLAEPQKLWPAWQASGAELAAAKRDATLLWIKEQEDAGLDIITDGEQSRQHFVHGFLERIEGIDFARKVKMGIRNNRYDAMVPVVTGPLRLTGRVHATEARLLAAHTTRRTKFTLPGPMTIVDTLADEYYGDRQKMAFAFADLLNQEARGLEADGIDIIQFDEPAFNVYMDDAVAWGIAALHRAIDGPDLHHRRAYLLRLRNRGEHHLEAGPRRGVAAVREGVPRAGGQPDRSGVAGMRQFARPGRADGPAGRQGRAGRRDRRRHRPGGDGRGGGGDDRRRAALRAARAAVPLHQLRPGAAAPRRWRRRSCGHWRRGRGWPARRRNTHRPKVRLFGSKARGALPPWTPCQGTSPLDPSVGSVPVGGGAAGAGQGGRPGDWAQKRPVSRPPTLPRARRATPHRHGTNGWVPRALPLAGVQGAAPPGLAVDVSNISAVGIAPPRSAALRLIEVNAPARGAARLRRPGTARRVARRGGRVPPALLARRIGRAERAAMPDQMARLPPAAAPAVAPRRRLRRGAVGAAVLLLLGLGGGWWWTTSRPAAARYLTAEATRGDITRTVTATGTVNPVLTVIVGTYVSGVIQTISCDYNTEVKQGQVCAKIDPRPYQAVVDQDKANLDIAKAQLGKDQAALAYAEVNYQRNRILAQRDYASKDVADNARNLYEQARAQVALDRATIEQRQAQLDAAQVNLGYTDIVSPVNGTVVSRNVTVGQTVAATFQTPTLFLIATDLTRMQVDTNVSESDIGAIKDGQAARFTVGAFPDLVFRGTVAQVRQSPQTVQNVVTYDVVVGVDNADLALKPGMTAATTIVTAARAGVLRVPDQALRYTPPGAAAAPPGTARVWVLRGGKPVAVAVVPGLDDDANTEILKGELQPGERVILGEERGAARAAALPVPRF